MLLALRERTRDLHAHAERSGFVRAMLRGVATRSGYALYLRNLLPVYHTLERGLEQHKGSRGVSSIVCERLYRAAAIEEDLLALSGSAWETRLPLLPVGLRYAKRIQRAAAADGIGLIGHAYTRYLGDLNGGLILRRRLAESPGLGPDALAFYRFHGIDEPDRYAAVYLGAFERAASETADHGAVIDGAVVAFQHTIELSIAVAAFEGAIDPS